MVRILVCCLILIYLIWQAVRAYGDFRAGRVEVRRWWLGGGWRWNPIREIDSSSLTKAHAPKAFWFWSLLQATLIGLLGLLFASILVLP